MERNKNLHPLSWQHHSGLVISRRINKGVANGSDLSLITQYIEFMWNEHLIPHFNLEESHLVPAMENHSVPEDIIKRLHTEHAQMRKQMQEIIRDSSHEKLGEFSKTLTDHIHFEERELFPLAERVIPGGELNRIGRIFHEAYVEKQVDWGTPFWKD